MDLKTLVDRNALFAVNHSGGKDSQAQLIWLLKQGVPTAQIAVFHADLAGVEWPGTLEHAQAQADAAGVPFIVARADKTFEQMVERRYAARPSVPSFPSASTRQCTSDLKRGPLEREIRRYAKAKGYSLIVSTSGVRAAESAARAKQSPWQKNERQSIAGREWYNWCPIFTLSTAEVFGLIKEAGQEPHWAYAAGNERLSCMFCIMGSKSDLRNGAKHNPALAQRLIALEEKTGYTMHMSRKSLRELLGIPVVVDIKTLVNA